MNNVTSVTDESVQPKKPLLEASDILLYECDITANDDWKLENIIIGSLLRIGRGVTLDFPASTIYVENTCISELESVDNIQGQGSWGTLTVEDSPYGPNGVVVRPKWIDPDKGMKLSTKPLEFIGTASDLIIADDLISEDDDYCLLSGKEYRLDLSKLISVDISDCEIAKRVVSGYSVKSELVDGTLDEFPAYVLRNYEVTVGIVPLTKSVLSINGATPKYNSTTGVYSADIDVSANMEITAELEDSANLCTLTIWHINLSNTEDKFTVTPAPNSLGQYRIGTECEIFANITDDKFIRDAQFNGVAIEPYKNDSSGCYYKVTTVAGENEFEITYVDLSTLTIAKLEHGSVEFSGRLDYGRSSETLADGTQVYSIGTSDMVTLTITPDKGYRLKSVKLDSGKAPEVTAENGVCTFMMDQCVDWTFTAEFEEIPAGSATVTVKCGANGTVTPATADYAIGTSVTLTVTPDNGYQVKSAQLDGKTVTLTNGTYTFTVTADCVFSVEFEEIPAGNATVTVKCGANGTVTPATADYPIGTSVTLTVTPDNGYQVKSAQLDGNAVTLTNGTYTFTVTADCVFSVEFQKKPTGGNSGGGSGRPSGRVNNDSTEDTKPTINGKAMSWEDAAKEINGLANGSEATIGLNGSYDVPADVIKAIADRKIKATFVIDGYRSWFMDGAEVTAPVAANLRVITLGKLDTTGLRGTAGYKFSLSGTNNPAALTIAFNKEYAGKFANLYKAVDGRLAFTGVVKVGADGSASLPDVCDKCDYVIMLGDYSDLLKTVFFSKA